MRPIVIFLVLLILVVLLMKRASGYTPFNPVNEKPKLIPGVLTRDECDLLIRDPSAPPSIKLRDLAAELAGKPKQNVEGVSVIKNDEQPSEFKCADNDSCSEFRNLGGDRIGVLVVNLNSEFKDGETEFPHLNLKFRPNPGCGLFWNPITSTCKRCHPKALHAGLPISEGTKYMCNAWVRERPNPPRTG